MSVVLITTFVVYVVSSIKIVPGSIFGTVLANPTPTGSRTILVVSLPLID